MLGPRLDRTSYPSIAMATEARAEELAYVALLAGDGGRDAIGVLDTAPDSPGRGRLVGRLELPQGGNGLHHLGWSADGRYLVAPGTRSSRIHVVDTRPDPRRPTLARVIEGDELARRTGYAAPRAVRCGPDGVYVAALGAAGGGGPGGLFVLDHETLDVRGRWEQDRGPQRLAGDFGWHLGHDTMITSEWGTPEMVAGGLDPALLRAGAYGHALHVWELRARRHRQTIDLGAEQQMVLELRPAHNPSRAYGFVGVVLSRADLSSSVWLWYRDHPAGGGRGAWRARKVITVPAEPAPADALPPRLRGFGATPPLVTDIALSLDDRFLYVSCWGTGELRQYDVSDPFNPVLSGSVRLGGVVRRAAHPGRPERPLDGGPQRVEVSRDGRRVYLTNSLHPSWDAQCYPDGLRGWLAVLEAGRSGGLSAERGFLREFAEGERPRQVRLQGGDASSDSFGAA